MISTKKPHFFIFLHPSLRNTYGPAIPQGFPQAFLREHGNGLSNAAFLQIPTGAEWRVELLKLNGEVLLGSGWQRFADFYSIGCDHFLLFRYEGSSHFRVLIFDRTSSEIEYPDATPPANHEQSLPEVSLEILKDFPSPTIDMIDISSSEETFHPNGASRLAKVEEVQSDFRTTQRQIRKTTGYNPSSGPAKACSSRPCGSSIPNFRDGALGRAEAFKSKNPFTVTMKPSDVSYNYRLNVPLRFFKGHFKTGSHNIMLSVSSGRSWSVRYIWGNNRIKFSAGWRKFVQDNSLRVGDVCTFELNKNTNPSLNVVISRMKEDAK